MVASLWVEGSDKPIAEVNSFSFGPTNRTYEIPYMEPYQTGYFSFGPHPLFDPQQFWDHVIGDVWITADRRHILVEDLEDSHLQALGPWCERQVDRIKEVFQEARDLGKVPASTTIFGLKDFPLFAAINREAQNRGLGNII